MNGMKCGKKGAQKLISEYVGSCTGECFFDWSIEKKIYGEVGWKSLEEWVWNYIGVVKYVWWVNVLKKIIIIMKYELIQVKNKEYDELTHV